MALSNYHLFVADSKGIIHTLRCDIKNGMLLVSPAVSRPNLGLRVLER